jgi:hypothetical protein
MNNSGFDALKQLRGIYSDKVINLLNTVSENKKALPTLNHDT